MADQERTQQTTRWEYHVSEVDVAGPGALNDTTRHANQIGRDGWELVTATAGPPTSKAGTVQLWFKRRIA